MKQKKLKIIVPIPSDDNYMYNPDYVTGLIYYKNYKIGTIEVSINRYQPLLNSGLFAPFNVEYKYTLIFDYENSQKQFNIALKSIQTTGFYKILGFMPFTRLLMPIGNFENIGYTPNNNKYNLELLNNSNEDMNIIISKIHK